MNVAAPTLAPAGASPLGRWLEPLLGLAVVGLAVGAVEAPLATAVALLTVAAVAGLARRPFLITAALIAVMGNVKVNLYLGFFTLFPEHLVLMVAAGLAFWTWLARPGWPPERKLLLAFALWAATGLLSLPYAIAPGRVLARVVLVFTIVLAWAAVVVTVDSKSRLQRAFAVWQFSAALYALYGIAQMIGLVAGFDTTLTFLKPYSNPDLFIGVGSPVRRRIGDVFRANAMFNDPNIMGGFLAAGMTLTLALRQHHSDLRRRGRAAAELVALVIMAACLLLTQSRSGLLGFFAGSAVLVAHRPGRFGRPAVWLGLAGGAAAIVGVAVLLGVDPTLLVTRLVGSGDISDDSNRQHLDVFLYGLQLVARYPLNGVGLGNFGLYYGPEKEAWFENMMTHSAPLTYFAESGIPGGIAFLLLWTWMLQRVIRVRPRDPDLATYRVALLASLASLLVANLFYDYITRTFVWVIAGLAVATVRIAGSPAAEATPR